MNWGVRRGYTVLIPETEADVQLLEEFRMAVKTAKRKTTTNNANISGKRTTPKRTSNSKTTAQMPARTGRPASATGQMNKGKGAAGVSKPPKPVSRPSGGTKPKGGKKGC